MKLEQKLERYLLPLVFLFSLGYGLWAAGAGWWNTIMDEHHFRQTQTAMTSFYMLHGGPFWKYETPVFGPPWSIPFEFPLYQWLAAKVAALSPIPLEQAGRLVGKFFYFAALWPIWSILGNLKIPSRRRLIFLSLYLLSPMYLYWSRCFLIESTALFFGLAYLAAAGNLFNDRNRMLSLVSVAILGILAGIIKATSFAVPLFAAGLWALWSWREKDGKKFPTLSAAKIVDIFFCFAIPLALTLAWTHFADAQKHLNPLSEFITSERLSKWNFGSFQQRISPATWNMFFRKTIHDSIGHRTTWIISVVFMLLLRKRWQLYLLGSFLFVLAPMIFTNLHIAHNYYWYANGVFLIFALGILIVAMLEAKKAWPILGMIFLISSLLLSIRQYRQFFYYHQTVEEAAGLATDGALVGAMMPDDGVMLLYGWDWYPGFPYYIKHRAIMNRDVLDLRSPEMKKIIAALPPYRLTHLALCSQNKNPAFLATLNQQGLQTKFLSHNACDIYQIISLQ